MKAEEIIEILKKHPSLDVKVQSLNIEYNIDGVFTVHDGTKPIEEREIPEHIAIICKERKK